MADEYRLTQTGAQVQADLDKVEGMAEIKSVGSGLSLSSAGELSASGGGGGTKLYLHSVKVPVQNDEDIRVRLWIVSTTSTAYTLQDLVNIFSGYGYSPLASNAGVISTDVVLEDTDVSYSATLGIVYVETDYSGNWRFVYVDVGKAIVEKTYTLVASSLIDRVTAL